MTITLRPTGLHVLGMMPWGTHVCLFYETKADLLDALVPFFGAGLEAHEFCMWAVSGSLTEEDARAALSRDIPGFNRHVAAGSMEILSGREWYLNGNEFDLKRIIAGWDEKLRHALAEGYEGLRVSGNAFWLNTNHWKDFCEYEHELEASLAGRNMTAVCTYALAGSAASDLLEAARAHDVAVARRAGKWEVIEAAEAPVESHALTPREREILAWVAQGKSAWKIGEILDIAKRTVDEHAQTAIRKLGAANRTQAVALALRRRIIEL